jgi:hypothetical protein
MQELDSSIVHRNLDAKIKIGGLEALDLLMVLVFSAFMGLFFDGGLIGFVFIFLLPLTLLIALYFIKRNKSEGYMGDVLRFYLSSGFYSATSPLKNALNLKIKIIKKEEPNE